MAGGMQPTHSWARRSSSVRWDSCLMSQPQGPKLNRKQKNPPKPWAKVLTAMTRQSSSASAKQRKGESNHQNWSPSNPMMLFIAPGVLCSVQQTSKMPLTALCTRGTEELWRGPVQAPATHAGVHRLEAGRAGNARPEHPSGRGPRRDLFPSRSHSWSLRGLRPLCPALWTGGVSWLSHINTAFLSVTAMNFFREDSLPAPLGHLSGTGTKVPGPPSQVGPSAFLSWD